MHPCPTRSGPSGVNAVGEDHLQSGTFRMHINVYCWGKRLGLKRLIILIIIIFNKKKYTLLKVIAFDS